jgi:futalosine hydrolase
VVSAWRPELAELRRLLPRLPAPVCRRLALGTVGVGLVEAALGASRLLAALRPRAVILVGTAGLYPGSSKSLRIGDTLVVGKMALLSDLEAGHHARLPEVMPRRETATPSLGKAIRQAARLPSENVACPLAITGSAAAAIFAGKKSGCALENLEAFSVARAAASLKIPFAAVLGIANHVGLAAHREWKHNAAAAAASACRAVVEYLSR